MILLEWILVILIFLNFNQIWFFAKFQWILSQYDYLANTKILKRDVPIEIEEDEKVKKYISIRFTIDHENDEALFRNFFENWVFSKNFENMKLLALAKEIHFCYFYQD